MEKVRAGVNRRFQGGVPQPDTVFVDRGKGFYTPVNGKITDAFKEALRANSFKAIHGENALAQPANFQDVLLHETAVSWMRTRLKQSLPTRCWQETPEAYAQRLKRCCDEVNESYDVEGLCRDLGSRIEALYTSGGNRLKH
jgi:hypothetical protein